MPQYVNPSPAWRGCFVRSQGKRPAPKHLQRWHLPDLPHLRDANPDNPILVSCVQRILEAALELYTAETKQMMLAVHQR